MCTVKKTAQISVRKSPILKFASFICVKKNNPIITMITPTIFSFLGAFLIMRYCAKGSSTTYVPVMNADFCDVVMDSPIVWVINPPKTNPPRISPYFRSVNFTFVNIFG